MYCSFIVLIKLIQTLISKKLYVSIGYYKVKFMYCAGHECNEVAMRIKSRFFFKDRVSPTGNIAIKMMREV